MTLVFGTLVLCNNGLFCLLLFSSLLLLKHFVCESTKYRGASIFLFTLIHLWVGIWLSTLMIFLSGDVKVNPGPRTKASNTFSVCHWNLNNISAINCWKALLKAYFTIHKFDIVSFSEIYLDSNTSADNDNQFIHLTVNAEVNFLEFESFRHPIFP